MDYGWHLWSAGLGERHFPANDCKLFHGIAVPGLV